MPAPTPNKSRLIEIFDTTLRDGSQGEDVNLSLEDKLAIAEKLDELGVHYIEGGWPAPSRLNDVAFFKRAKKLKLKSSKLVAFGSTRRADSKAGLDPTIQALLKAETRFVCIFGKSWDLHVTKVLRCSLDENLRMISDSVKTLRKRRDKVFYDAEHFFDGYKRNPAYALATLRAAHEAGAACLVLCDTNGGCLPWEIEGMVSDISQAFKGAELGIHVHNDAELAVANTLAAVSRGVTHVQGCVNGLGERCGNANLVSVIPNLKFKMGLSSIPDKSLPKLTQIARTIASIANIPVNDHQSYVGLSAFAHKAGVHIDAVLKDSRSYEHIQPEQVGNERRLLASEQAGKATILSKARKYGVKLKGHDSARDIIARIKELEHQGYQFEGADASFELLMRQHLGQRKPYFKLESYRVEVEKTGEQERARATVLLLVKGSRQHTTAEGNGPVNALDQALRKALIPFYPGVKATRLIDYKVRVLQSRGGSAAKVRVLMETTDGKMTWNTVGVHENIIEASWEALVDSVEYKLLKDAKR
jgi:2-isopropylmalate synthase